MKVGGGGGEERKRLQTNPSILKTCVRRRTQRLIGSASQTMWTCVDQRFVSYCEDGMVRDAWSARLQNSPYFCVFRYGRAVEQKVWNEAENIERDWGETLKIRLKYGFFSLASHTLRACEARALCARKTLTPRFTDFFTDFEKKTDCFAV